jgi:polyketide synthase PksN
MELKSILKALKEKKITPEEARRKIQEFNSSFNETIINSGSKDLIVEEQNLTPEVNASERTASHVGGKFSEHDDRIAIIGISGRYPDAENINNFWDILANGKNAVKEIPVSRWDINEYYDPEISKEGKIYCKWLGMLDDVECFDSLFFEIPPSEAEMMDPQHRLFLQEGYRAFEDAGYSRSKLNNKKCGVYLGIVNGEYGTLSQQSDTSNASVTGHSNAIGAARIAYYLNLKGPAISIDTACSSSLVSTHLAVQALLRGEVDMALAGGVSLYLTPESYISMCSAGMLSADGQCKAFDNGANGFVPGEGVGAVVLKRLKDAEADGDYIYGVVIGSAINQDGKTNGITAPNLGSQIELVRDMYDRYNIDPKSISYAELHGTGTKLGDPIELEALSAAFSEKTDEKNYCAIGSVKSNIGHTSAAAAMAGIHKILLSMKHKKLVPTIHVKTPNEHFDFKNSPFVINTETKEWNSSNGVLRRASISSFGYSGTNAHAVIEEYDTSRYLTQSDRDEQGIEEEHPGVFVLSAKNATQLKIYAENMRNYLVSNMNTAIINLLYTLQTGREPMEERLAIITSSVDDLMDKLSRYLSNGADSKDILQGRVIRNKLRNKGSQVQNNGNEDKKDTLTKLAEQWIAGEAVEWEKSYSDKEPRKIPLPTYPFEKEVHWLKRKDPHAVQREPEMNVLHPLLHENVSDFSEQCFRSAFTGKEFFVNDHMVNNNKILPGTAVLEMARAAGEIAAGKKVSSISNINWIYPIKVDESGQVVKIRLYPEVDKAVFELSIPDESAQNSDEEILCAEGTIEYQDTENLSPGNKLIDIEACRSRCQTKFDTRKHYKTMNHAGLSYGPRFQTLEEAAYNQDEVLARVKLNVRNSKEETNEYMLHPGLLDGALQTISLLLQDNEENGERVYLPFSMGRIVIYSSLAETGYVYTKPAGRDVTPHERQTAASLIKSFDITVTDDEGNTLAAISDFKVKHVQGKSHTEKNTSENQKESGLVSTFHYKNVWEVEDINAKRMKQNALDAVLVFDVNNELQRALTIQSGIQAILVMPGTEFKAVDPHTFVINPSTPADYQRLLEELSSKEQKMDRIIYNWSNDASIYGEEQIADRLERGVYSLLGLSQALIAHKPKNTVKLLYVYQGDRRDLVPENSAMKGFFRTLQMENPLFQFKTIEFLNSTASVSEAAALLLEEFLTEDNLLEIRYDGKRRWGKKVKALDEKHDMLDSDLKNNSVYVITGGIGGLGLIVARYVSEKVKARFVLTGRREPNEKDLAAMREIEGLGSEVLYVKADISKREEAAELVSKAKSRFHHINGVIHSAGVLRDSLVWKKTPEEVAAVLAAKVYGTRYLDEFLKDEPLDFFVMFSSLASVVGNIGQSDYSFANSYMDHFAAIREEWRRSGNRSGKTLSINWPFWNSGGMGIDIESKQMMEEKAGIAALDEEEGMRVFEEALRLNVPQLIVVKGKKDKVGQLITSLNGDAKKLQTSETSIPARENRAAEKVNERLREDTEEFLKAVLSEKTKMAVEKIDVLEPFEAYGIDSILIMSLTRVLEQSFGELSKTLFFEYRNLKELADYFLENETDKLIEMFDSIPKNDEKDKPQNNGSKERMETEWANRKRPRFLKTETEAEKEQEDIAIIGVSGRYPMADNLEQFWDNLKSGKDCISEIPKDRWDHRKYYDADKQSIGKAYSKWGGFINDAAMFDPLFFNISPIEAEQMDPQARLFMQTAWQALEDAGYTRAALEKDKVGVYVGVMYGMYQLFEGEVKGKRVPIGSSFASIANQVSYFCNFTGPSLAVDTMCSSSLTALHLGCESIRRGESDLVIAGGVNLTVHPNKHIMLSLGKFASSDGRCRSFGEGGDGYVPGEGVGAVLLKPLKKAIEDKDHIYGVIKGSSINSGGKTSGFTVPNPNAQGDLISDVIKKADIDPQTISYIESHGTGTSLGDPIEITGLTKAFGKQTSDTQFCSIGSVKSNIGHLESASGIAALTKVLLQMQNTQLVPSLHSETLNPNINFKKTPFYVQQKLERWDEPVVVRDGRQKKTPRRAGISSFGAGGANAHVIVEEFKARTEEDTVSTSVPKLFVLSARNEERVREYARLLIDYVTKNKSLAHLQDSVTAAEKPSFEKIRQIMIGIAAQIIGIDTASIDPGSDFEEYGFDIVQLMRFKKMVSQELELDFPESEFNMCSSIDTLAKYVNRIMSGEGEQESHRKLAPLNLSSIAYTLQVGREAMEERVAIIAHSSEELVNKLTLYLDGSNQIEQLYKGNILDTKQRLKQIIAEQTGGRAVSDILNAKELESIAALWTAGMDIDWNQLYGANRPYRVSLPTYPFAKEYYWAKTMIGSISIKNSPIDSIHPLLDKNTSNINELRYSTVFTGEEFFLEDHIIGGKKILPGVVYLEMARAAAAAALEVSFGADTSVRIKNVVWIKPVEVDSTPVTLHISLLPEDSGDIEFTIYSDEASQGNERTVHCQGRASLEKVDEVTKLDIGRIKSQCAGAKVSGEAYYQQFENMGINYGPAHQGIDSIYIGENQILAELSIPEKAKSDSDYFILHPSLLDSALQATIALSNSSQKMPATGLTETTNRQKAKLPFALNEVKLIRGCSTKMLALIRQDQKGGAIPKMNIDLCDEEGNVCIQIKEIAFRVLDDGAEPSEPLDKHEAESGMFVNKWNHKNGPESQKKDRLKERLVILCEPEEKLITDIQNRLDNTTCIALQSGAKNIAQKYQDYSAQLLHEFKKLFAGLHKEKVLVQLFIETNSENQVLAGFSGFLKTVQMESHHIVTQLIESSKECGSDEICQCLEESGKVPYEQHVRYTENGRFVAELERIEAASTIDHCWKDNGIYVITGGAGGLGLIVANEIVNRAKNVTLVLAGRSVLQENTATKLQELEAAGAKVIYQQADVTDSGQVTEFIQKVVQDFGNINGIIHCSGVIRDNLLMKKKEDELLEVLAPKVSGIYHLDQAVKDLPLDLFIIFSSMAGATGNIGQADYAAANAFMDCYAAYRNRLAAEGKRFGQAISINWPLWRDGGMRISTEVEKMIEEGTGLIPMHTETGIDLLYKSIASGETQVLALEGNIKKISSYLSNHQAEEESEGIQQEEQDVDQDSIKEQFAHALKQILSSELKLPVNRIDARVPLETYGINSVMIIQLTTQLEKRFGSLPKTLFFEYQSLLELSEYFCESHPEQVKAMLGIKKKPAAALSVTNSTLAGGETSDKRLTGKARIWQDRKYIPAHSDKAKTRETDGLDIAIIGVAGKYPQAASLEEFWNNLKNGKDCITEIPKDRWDHSIYYDEDKSKLDKTYAKWGGFIDGIEHFDPLFFTISPNEAQVLDPQERLFLQCAYHAIEDAGYTRHTIGKNKEFGLGSNVGVFVGVMYEEYQLYGAQAQARGQMYALSGSPSSIANRVSYSFGFHGPSMAIDTMCSSSLVSIHLACQSIQNGECEAAIAGGVNLSLHPNKFLMLGQNRFMSSTGRCQSFGKDGDGYTPGEGVGAVILKSKAQAIADGDQIYGIIKGSAINHGGKTNGYTVPNPRAQAGLIKKALKKSGVNPRTISYIEAHGTGTSLGDPIEIAGLNHAFQEQTKDRQFCMIGSAKSNIGHCESAAGIAGLTKVLLQMKHKQIVPSLHSNELNPNIDFVNSPFMVSQEVTEWKRPMIEENGELMEYPRIAGISAFGAGGSNAHLIIEEYNPEDSLGKEESETSEPAMINLSARKEEQLKEQVKQFITWIQKEAPSDRDLGTIAYTLQVGREAMEERLAFTVTSIAELEHKLADFLKGTGDCYRGKAKSINNVLSILDSDMEFQSVLDKWHQQGKYEKMLELWVKGLSIDWSSFYSEKTLKRISLPVYPFAKEPYWIPVSNPTVVQPAAIRINQFIHPLVHQNTSDFNQQRYSSAFTGNESFFTDHLVNGKKMMPAVAYVEMAYISIVNALKRGSDETPAIQFRDVVWLRPLIIDQLSIEIHIELDLEEDGGITFTIYSLSENDLNKIIYCQGSAVIEEHDKLPKIDLEQVKTHCDQMRIESEQVYQQFKSIGLDYGFDQRGIESLQLGKDQVLAHLMLPESLKDTLSDYSLHPCMLDSALQAAIGVTGERDPLAKGSGVKDPKLPFMIKQLTVYKESSREMWSSIRPSHSTANQTDGELLDIDICDSNGNVCVRIEDIYFRSIKEKLVSQKTGLESAISSLMCVPEWEEQELSKRGSAYEYSKHIVVVCEGNERWGYGLRLELNDVECITLKCDSKKIEDRFNQYAVELFDVVKNVISGQPQEMAVIQVVAPFNEENYLYLGLAGLLKTANQENPNIHCQIIGVEGEKDPADLAAKMREDAKYSQESTVLDRNGKRLVFKMKEYNEPKQMPAAVWRDGGVYLITGGMGGLGLVFAKEAANKVENAVIVLAGRSALTEAYQTILNDISSKNVTVIYKQADVSMEDSVAELLREIRKDFGGLNGIIHCAGVVQDNFIFKKTRDEFRKVLSPKVQGTIYLDKETKDMDLDFFVLCSSLSGITGNVGQADYAAANAFMDAFCAYRDELVKMNRRKGQSVSINWPLWQEGGIHLDESFETAMEERTGITSLRTETGLQLFYQTMALKKPQVIALEGYAEKIRSVLMESGQNHTSDEVVEETENVPNANLNEKAMLFFKEIFSGALKIPVQDLEQDEPLERYGIDSILIMKLTEQLEKSFGSLPKTLLFECQNIQSVTDYFLNHYSNQLKKLIMPAAERKPAPSLAVKPAASEERSSGKKKGVISAMKKPRTKPIKGETLSTTDIAIIGMSGAFAGAENLEEYWENLYNGRDCITEVPLSRWDHSKYFNEDKDNVGTAYSKWGGFMKNIDCFDPLFFNISPTDAEIMDPQERLFMQSVYEALQDAGYTRQTLGYNPGSDVKRNAGVYVGVMSEDYQLYAAQEQKVGNPIVLSGNPSSIANRVSYFCDFHGPSLAIDTMCSSSLVAIHMACQAIKHGECELAVAGGVNVISHPNKYLLISQGKFASTNGKCVSFGKGGDGYVPGEGVGALILKSKDKAIADGDHIYGIIKGTSINHGGKTNGYTVPNPQAQAEVISTALKSANISADTISYVEAHGTGTALGDPIEIAALNKVFRETSTDTQYCAIGSVKSNIGHCESASGIAAVSKVLLQMKHGKIVPSLHSTELNPNIDFSSSPFFVPQEVMEWERPVSKVDGEVKEYPRIAGVSSFGAGGANAHIILEEYIPEDEKKLEVSPQQEPVLIVLSAKSKEQLLESAKRLLHALSKQNLSEIQLTDIAYTLQVGREAMEERLAFAVQSPEMLINILKDIVANSELEGVVHYGQVYGARKSIYSEKAEELRQSVRNCIELGQYDQLCEYWVNGVKIDWNALYEECRPKRVSLPAYPFERERYWVKITPDQPVKVTDKDLPIGPGKIHPLIHTNHSSLYQQLYRSTFTGHEFFLNDHRLGDRKVLPGAAILEMARLAGELSTEEKVNVIKGVIWMNQIEVTNESGYADIHLYPNGQMINFEVNTPGKAEGGSAAEKKERIVCTEGKLEYREDLDHEQQSMDIAQITARCTTIDKGNDCYDAMTMKGLINGESFQVIKEIHSNHSEALAFLSLTPEMRESAKDYALHPALLNGAFQTVLGLMESNGQTESQSQSIIFLPFALSEMRIFAPLTNDCVAYVTRSNQSETMHASIQKFDITITDNSGKILVFIDEFTLKSFKVEHPILDQQNDRVIRQSSSYQKSDDEFTTHFYSTEWFEMQNDVDLDSVNHQAEGTILIFDQDETLYREIKEQLRNQNDDSEVILVKPGNSCRQAAPHIYEINLMQQDDYDMLLRKLEEQRLRPDRIVLYRDKSDEDLSTHLEDGIFSLFYLSKALMKQKIKSNIRLLFAFVNDQDEIIPEYSAVSGFAKTIRMENPAFLFRTVELQTAEPYLKESIDESIDFTNARLLVNEFNHHDSAVEVRYESSNRFVKGVKEIAIQ